MEYYEIEDTSIGDTVQISFFSTFTEEEIAIELEKSQDDVWTPIQLLIDNEEVDITITESYLHKETLTNEEVIQYKNNDIETDDYQGNIDYSIITPSEQDSIVF
jgi:hypothetical protein